MNLSLDVPISAHHDVLMGDTIFMLDALHGERRARFWVHPHNKFKIELFSYLGCESKLFITDVKPRELTQFNVDITPITFGEWPNAPCCWGIARAFGVSYEPLRLRQWNPDASSVYIVGETYTKKKQLPIEHLDAISKLFQKDRIRYHRVHGNMDTVVNYLPPFQKMVNDLLASRLCISIDTGPLWLACTMGIPCVGLFNIYAPWAFCRGYFDVMRAVWIKTGDDTLSTDQTVDGVLRAIERLPVNVKLDDLLINRS